MSESIKNSLRIFMAIILVAALQLPIVIKISHALYEHVEIDCDDLTSLHFHEAEFDCDYQKFNLSTNCIVPNFEIVDHRFLAPRAHIFSAYSFLSKYQKLHFSLRGPPSLS